MALYDSNTSDNEYDTLYISYPIMSYTGTCSRNIPQEVDQKIDFSTEKIMELKTTIDWLTTENKKLKKELKQQLERYQQKQKELEEREQIIKEREQEINTELEFLGLK